MKEEEETQEEGELDNRRRSSTLMSLAKETGAVSLIAVIETAIIIPATIMAIMITITMM